MTTIKSTVKTIPTGFFNLLHKLGFKSATRHVDCIHITVALDWPVDFVPGMELKISGDSDTYLIKDIK